MFLDLDLVLLDVGQRWYSMCAAWARERGIETEAVIQIGKRIWMEGKPYWPELHLELVGLEDSPTATRELMDFYAWLDQGGAVYTDVVPFFEKRARPSIRFSVASFGEEAFQTRKVRSTGVPPLRFAHIHIIPASGLKAKRMIECRGDGERLVLLDDNGAEHEAAARVDPDIIRVQMLRSSRIPRSEHAQHYVANLEEFDQLLSRLHL